MSEFDCRRSNRSIKSRIIDETRKQDYERRLSCSKNGVSTMPVDQLDPSLRDLILKPKSKKIPRPPNAFMLFARDHRKSLAKKYPSHSNKNISSLLGECWRKMDGSTQGDYYKKAKMLEELHRQQYPGYFYSPRIARIQKMARKKKQSDKCEDNIEPNDDEIPLEPTGPSNACNHGSEKCCEWKDGKTEKKQSSPGYIPNNPQYFPDPEQGSQPELPCTAQSNTPAVTSHVHDCCPPPPWNMPTEEPTAVPCAGRCPDECRAGSSMYAENYYPKVDRSEVYNYGPWNQYPDFPYEYPVSTWSVCASGCQGECSMIHLKDEHSSYSHLSSLQHPDMKDSCYHYHSATPYRNHPYSCTYGPYNDSPLPCVPGRYVPYKTRPKAHSSYFPQYYYQNQYQQHLEDYYSKVPHTYATQPADCPSVQETTCSSGYQYQQHLEDNCSKVPLTYATQPADCPSVQETTCSSGYQYQQHLEDNCSKVPLTYATQPANCPSVQETTCPSGYHSEVYDCHPVHTEEMNESNNTAQGVESQYQDVEQANIESDGSVVVNVVDVSLESNILTEEVVESTNPEHGQVGQDVYFV